MSYREYGPGFANNSYRMEVEKLACGCCHWEDYDGEKMAKHCPAHKSSETETPCCAHQ